MNQDEININRNKP